MSYCKPLVCLSFTLYWSAAACAGGTPEVKSMPEQKPAIETRAREALAQHLQRERSLAQNVAEQFELLSSEAVEWPNPGLGCPEPGMMYPQVIVPGHKVTLKFNNTVHAVHLSAQRAVVCEHPTPLSPADVAAPKMPQKLGTLKIETLTAEAKADLAKKINVPLNQIALVSIKPMTWDNEALGCPDTGRHYEATPVKGYRLVLRARDREYSYHTDQGSVVIPCPKIESM